ncbi:MAG: hypothetical protein AABY84_08675 [Candidatus Firestonebacteria bacterium]
MKKMKFYRPKPRTFCLIRIGSWVAMLLFVLFSNALALEFPISNDFSLQNHFVRKFDKINSDIYIYKSKLKPEFVIDFYRNNMVKYQWKLLQHSGNLEVLKTGQILHFIRDKSEYCMIHISSDEGNTYIVIIVHQ